MCTTFPFFLHLFCKRKTKKNPYSCCFVVGRLCAALHLGGGAQGDVFEATWSDKDHAVDATPVAVKVFRASGTLASYLRRIYVTSSASSSQAATTTPPPLPEALRSYIFDHHHHKRPPEEEDEEDDEECGLEEDTDLRASSPNHDANEPGVYAARELLAMFLVRFF